MTHAHPDPSLPLPSLRVLGAETLPLEVEPPALLTALEGEALVIAEDERFRLRNGESLVLRRGAALRVAATGVPATLARFQVTDAWRAAFRALHGLVEPDARRALELVPAGTALSRRVAQLLAGHRLSPGAGVELVISPAAAAGLLEVMDEARCSPLDARRAGRSAGSRREALMEAFASYDPAQDERFSLWRLAERLGLSERQTARLIRAETGRSFSELKTATRLERAQKLLAATDLPLLEVALRSGWNSTSQFHDAFRRAVGMSPARYRGAHR
jgi:AraC-like DNA-binding protein